MSSEFSNGDRDAGSGGSCVESSDLVGSRTHIKLLATDVGVLHIAACDIIRYISFTCNSALSV